MLVLLFLITPRTPGSLGYREGGAVLLRVLEKYFGRAESESECYNMRLPTAEMQYYHTADRQLHQFRRV